MSGRTVSPYPPGGFYDPPWAFSVPEAGASAMEVDRWIAQVADDLQRHDGVTPREKAERIARRMLAARLASR